MPIEAGTAARLLRDWILHDGPIQHTTERELQDGLERRLANRPDWIYSVAREHRLDDRNRIDFLVRIEFVRVGIEVKIFSALAEVTRQLERYAHSYDVDALLLVTTKAIHHRIPNELNGKPVVLCSLVEVGL